MDFSSVLSEFSSGCESGWTFYLKETSRKTFHDHHHNHPSCRPDANEEEEEEEEEEDLSMVSDASSGPPQIHHDEQCKENSRFGISSNKKKNKAKEHCFLDDTASSPGLNYPIEYINKSNNQHAFGFSHGNGVMGNSAFGDQIGIGRQQEQSEASRSLPRRRR